MNLGSKNDSGFSMQSVIRKIKAIGEGIDDIGSLMA